MYGYNFGYNIAQQGANLNLVNPYDLSAQTFHPKTLDDWIIANSSLTGKSIILPNIPRSYYSTTEFTTLNSNNTVTYAGSTLADTDAILEWYADNLPDITALNLLAYNARTGASDDYIATIQAAGITVLVNEVADIEFVAVSVNEQDGLNTNICDKPVDTQEGDFMIAYYNHNVASGEMSAPEGWTEIRQGVIGARSLTAGVFYKFAGESEPANYQFSTTATTSRNSVTIASYRNVDSASPVDAYEVGEDGGVIDVVADSITTTQGNDMLLLSIFIDHFETTTISSSPASMTERINSGVYQSVFLLDETLGTAEATGTRTVTLDTIRLAAWMMLALKNG